MCQSLSSNLSAELRFDKASSQPATVSEPSVWVPVALLDSALAALDRAAAEMRPGRGVTNIGLTPKRHRERAARLDALRADIRAAAAAGVRP